MTASTRPASREAGFVFSGALLLGAVLVFAPLIKGGNRPIPLLVLELAALLLLVLAALRPAFAGHLPRAMLAALAGLAALPLLQLLPLPPSLWSALPGRDFYAAALAAVGAEAGFRGMSLIPWATQAAGLALLPPLAVFLTATALPDEKLKTLAHGFIALAVAQALIGLAQYGMGSTGVVFAGEPTARGMGTYANPDHLAGLLEMALPLALALLAMNVHPGGPGVPHRRGRGLRQRLSGLFSQEFRMNRTALLASASIAILLGLVFTRSRTGVSLGMLGILLCALVFARRIGGERSTRLVTVLSVIGFALALEIGLAPVLQRFTDQTLLEDSRWPIYSATLDGIGEFFPLGSGIGTFPEVFRRFQPGDVPLFVNHAHNDYLEWLFEGGLFAGALVAVFLALYALRWPQLWTRERWSHLRYLQVGAGIGLLLLGLHGLVDFNLHIPANAITFAFLAGLFFHREHEAPPAHRPKKQQALPERKPDQAPAAAAVPAPQPENGRNPFAD